MRFQWPELLGLLALLPLLVLGYRWLLRRRAMRAVRFSSLQVIGLAVAQGTTWRRHLPAALLLIGIGLGIVGLARPSAVVSVPMLDRTVILAIDVSGSMRAKDISPDRFSAAKQAAKEFIESLPASTRVGIVAFAATATVVQIPTAERDDLMAAIDALQMQRGTATGSAILISLRMLFPDLQFDLQAANPRPRAGGNAARPEAGASRGGQGKDEKRESAPGQAQPGSYKSAAIILVTDGQANMGPDPVESAKMAAERGVRVHVIGIGTPQGFQLSAEGWSARVRLDEAALRKITDTTTGSYFQAANRAELRGAYDALSARISFERRDTEVSAFFAAAAALMLLLASGLSAWWFGRLL